VIFNILSIIPETYIILVAAISLPYQQSFLILIVRYESYVFVLDNRAIKFLVTFHC